MDYKIRAATPDDHDFIYKLKAESVRPYVEKIWGWDETYQRMDFDNDFSGIEQFHVVEAAGSLAYFVQYYWNHSCLEIVEIHLRSEYQGHGIGSDIIQYLQKSALLSAERCGLVVLRRITGPKVFTRNLVLHRWRKRTLTTYWYMMEMATNPAVGAVPNQSSNHEVLVSNEGIQMSILYIVWEKLQV